MKKNMRLSSFLLVFCTITLVRCWGELGHRTVAYLAERYLTSEGSDLVSSLLENDRGYDISDAALWADTIKRKREYAHTGEWHYIDAADNPPILCEVNYKRDCHEGPGCIVSAIKNFTSRVNDKELEKDQQKEALMFVIHFLGDIHQPLHTELLSRGGNDIKVDFEGRRSNLHSIWDTEIPHKLRGLKAKDGDDSILKAAASKWAGDLFAANETQWVSVSSECKNVTTAEECALAWATESNAKICSNVFKRGVEYLKTNDLSKEYFEDAAPILNEQVARAGLRLGAWLNALAEARSYMDFKQETEQIEM